MEDERMIQAHPRQWITLAVYKLLQTEKETVWCENEQKSWEIAR